MRYFLKIFGVIAMIAVIVFGVTACGNINDDDSGVEYGWYGNGSKDSFTIKNAAQLGEFGKIVTGKTGSGNPKQSDFTGKTVTLTADIDMSGKGWSTIGSEFAHRYPFNGTFDGNNKTISGLQMNGGDFFALVGEDGTVKNMVVTLSGTNQGCFIENNKGLIQNISISGTISNSGSNSGGGVVSYNASSGIIENCSFSGSITGDSYNSYIGGMVRTNWGIVRNCFVTGSVKLESAMSSTVGGIVGQNQGQGTVENCYSTGNVIGGSGGSVGGIVGQNSPASIVKNCYAIGDVSGRSSAGGVVGSSSYSGNYNNSGTIENCYATGNVTGLSGVGGISGSIGRVKNCVALNPSVTATTTNSSSYNNTGRVSGRNENLLDNNYGSSGMTLSRGGTFTITSEANGIHGADVEAADYNSQTWWTTTLNWDFSTVWEWDSARNLPKLRM